MALGSDTSSTLNQALIGVVATAACGVFGGWVMALAGARGARLMGGLLAGIVLGPAIAGSVWPEWHGRHIRGGVSEIAELENAQRATTARSMAEMAAGAPSQAADAQRDRERISAAQVALNDARARHWLPRSVALAVLTSLVLIGLAPRRVASGGSASPMAMRVFVAAAPAIAALLFSWWWLDSPWSPSSLVIIAATCCGCGVLSVTHRRICDRLSLVEPDSLSIIWRDGRVAMLLAGIVFLLALSEQIKLDAPLTLAWVTVTSLLFVGMWRVNEAHPTGQLLARIANTIALPAMAALAVCGVPLAAFEWAVPALILAIISGDGRTLGWFLGSVLSTTRTPGRSLMLGAMGSGAAPMQAAFTAGAISLDLIPGWLGFSLLAAALSTELLVMPERLGLGSAPAAD